MWRTRADVARGCDEALRPRGRTECGPREAQAVRTRGRRPRGSTWTPMRGATWQSGGWHLEGPRVSGPWLGVWGGNANALPRPNSYTHDLFSFIPCGTMSPRKHTFARHVVALQSSERIAEHRSHGLGSTRSSSRHVC